MTGVCERLTYTLIASNITTSALRRRLADGISGTHLVTGRFECAFKARRESPSILDWYQNVFRTVSGTPGWPDPTILTLYRALGSNLLYRFERPQYAEILRKYAYGPDVPAEQVKTNSKLYGAEHLLRLLGTLSPSLHFQRFPNDRVGSIASDTSSLCFYGCIVNAHYPRVF